MAKGLLPARRVGGMAASAASPETAASTAIGASTSISASRPGFRSRAGSGGSRLESNTGSWRSADGLSGSAATATSGWRGALLREVQAL